VGAVNAPASVRRELPVVVPCPPERLDELFRLRAAVWLAEGADAAAFPGGSWRDARDDQRLHWMAEHAGEIVAGASLSIHASLDEVHQAETYRVYGITAAGPVAAPARVIVRGDWRGTPLVRRLLDAQDDAARAAGAVLALRQASAMLRPLLERRGWRCHGPALPDARFPGQDFSVMTLPLER